MAQKLNTEFNYRYQVIGDTPWERIKTLKSFLEGRIRALALEEVSKLKHQAKLSKLNYLKNGGEGLEHEILELKAEILEADSHQGSLDEAFELTKDEIKILKIDITLVVVTSFALLGNLASDFLPNTRWRLPSSFL